MVAVSAAGSVDVGAGEIGDWWEREEEPVRYEKKGNGGVGGGEE